MLSSRFAGLFVMAGAKYRPTSNPVPAERALAAVIGFLICACIAMVEASIVATFGHGGAQGGIILGVAETTTGFYLSTGYKDVPGLVLLLIVLALKPAGLFGKTAIKKV